MEEREVTYELLWSMGLGGGDLGHLVACVGFTGVVLKRVAQVSESWVNC